MTRIAFRLDASREIGAGHFSRCLTLAQALRERGAQTLFLSRNLPADLAACLASEGHVLTELLAVTVEQEAIECAHILNNFRPDWLIVDHYKLDARWEIAVRDKCGGIFVIDDKADRPHSCDILLDQNFNPRSQANYRAFTQPDTRLLLGPLYALLPPDFAAKRAERGVVTGEVKRVLICFGGSDPGNHTATAIEAIRPFVDRLEQIDVIIGSLSQNKENIASLCRKLPNAHLYSPTRNMSQLLLQADLAIGAGGTMTWERACLGVPSLAFGIAENQVAILEALSEAGIIGGQASMPIADQQTITRWIGIALDSAAFLRGLSSRSLNLVDGLGAERVARQLMPVSLTFRPATLSDSEQLLRWRNAPEIRKVSINSSEISLACHHAWMLGTLSDPSRQLFIAEVENRAIGVVRFDLAPPQAAISIYRIPDEQPRHIGLIKQATNWFLRQHPEITRIIAEVKSNNLTSLSAFRTAGYLDTSTSLVFEREIS
jgi:UDP-2,4-diacetamido-2,4,6-trideoxy-beta-L-altropyranose hydrolase